MNALRLLFTWLWIPVLVAALAFWSHNASVRVQRVETVTAMGLTSPGAPSSPPAEGSATAHRLIATDHHADTYAWISTIQTMASEGTFRNHRAAWDNAPAGRPFLGSSLFAQWTLLVARVDSLVVGSPLHTSIERAALYAGPALQLLALVAGALLAFRAWGPAGALLATLALAFGYPLNLQGLPGVLDPLPLSIFIGLAAFVPLLRALGTAEEPAMAPAKTARRLIISAVASAASLWVAPQIGFPLVLAIGLAGLTHAFDKKAARLPWRLWGLAGASVCLAGSLWDVIPAYADGFELRSVHPLYGLCWVGLGEFLHAATVWRHRETRTLLFWIFASLGLMALLTLPGIQIWKEIKGWLDTNASLQVFSLTPGATAFENSFAWLSANVSLLERFALLAPVAAALPALVLAAVPKAADADRVVARFVLVLLVGTAGWALFRTRAWAVVEGVSVLGFLASAPGLARLSTSRWTTALATAGAALALLPGAFPAFASSSEAREPSLTAAELDALFERDVSLWLARHTEPGRVVALAPASLSTSLAFHGGARIVFSPYPENQDGPLAAIRICGSPYPDEAGGLLKSRVVTHLLLPSWDKSLEELARLRGGNFDGTLVGLINRWLPPRYLKPIAYHPPAITGVEARKVLILEVVEVQDEALTLSHLGEYFAEMDMPSEALQVCQALASNFGDDLNGLITRAAIYHLAEDKASFKPVFERLIQSVDDPEAMLTWDRRALRTIVLAQGKKPDLARKELAACMQDADAAKLRSLSSLSVYRFAVLSKAFNTPFPTKELQSLAKELAPEELRSKL